MYIHINVFTLSLPHTDAPRCHSALSARRAVILYALCACVCACAVRLVGLRCGFIGAAIRRIGSSSQCTCHPTPTPSSFLLSCDGGIITGTEWLMIQWRCVIICRCNGLRATYLGGSDLRRAVGVAARRWRLFFGGTQAPRGCSACGISVTASSLSESFERLFNLHRFRWLAGAYAGSRVSLCALSARGLCLLWL